MTTISDIRARVRQDLHDEDATAYRWTDGELDRHLDRAVRTYSNFAPLSQRTLLATTAGSRWLDLASLVGLVRVARVEYPVGRYPPAYAPFSAWGIGLLLLTEEPPTGDNAEVYWLKAHTLDASGSTLPGHHEDLIATGAAAYAALAWASFAINRVNVSGADAAAQYKEWGEARRREFEEALRILGDRARPGTAPRGLRTATLMRVES